MLRILMICEAFGGGVFTYVSQLCNDICRNFEVHLAYSVRPQTPKNYKEFLDPKIHLIEVKKFGQITDVAGDIKVIHELQAICILRLPVDWGELLSENQKFR